MGVGLAGKRSTLLDVPEHFSWYVVNMASQESVRKRAGMYLQLNHTAGFYPSISGKNSNVLPWWQESLQSAWSAVPVVEFFC